MDYLEWNKRLVKQFFNPENSDEEVLLCVDKEFFCDKIAPELGLEAWRDLVCSAIAFYSPGIRVNSTICDKALSLFIGDWRLGDSPPFVGFLCIMVLAWTHDDERHALNYYGRLQSLLDECGQDAAVPHIDSQKFSKSDLLWSGLSHWANRMKKGAWGVFNDSSIGPDIHVGRPLRHALMSASDRHKLRRLFADQNPMFTAELPTPREMGEFLDRYVTGRISANGVAKFRAYRAEFIRFACGIYERLGEIADEEGAVKLVDLKLSIQSGRLGRKSLGVNLHYKDENFPQETVHAKLGNNTGAIAMDLIFARYQYGWSSAGMMVATRQDWVPDAAVLAGKTWVILSVESKELRVRGGGCGVFFFEKSGFGPSRQRLSFLKDVPCYVLVADGNPVASAFKANNETCLTPEPLSSPISGWSLFSSNGLRDLSGLAQASEARHLVLVGGARLFAHRNVYYRNTLPALRCRQVPIDAELLILDEESGTELKQIHLTGDQTVRFTPEDLAGSQQVQLRLVTSIGEIEQLHLRIQDSTIALGLTSEWPLASQSFFPYDASLVVTGLAHHGSEEVAVKMVGEILSVDVAPLHEGWLVRLGERCLEGHVP